MPIEEFIGVMDEYKTSLITCYNSYELKRALDIMAKKEYVDFIFITKLKKLKHGFKEIGEPTKIQNG